MKEAENIRRKLPPSSRLIALCVEGRLRSSEELARTMAAWAAGTELVQGIVPERRDVCGGF